ncbi:MAG TPA: aldehyde ferredoxin oxidoreductase [Deltaproteobacteria bacterium]|nr:aldehyde ferredoxin oxidoreductase [Deltaproteobacteria bacterium]
MNGYAGRITHVNLSSGKIRHETFTEDFAKKYLGGNGFAVRALLEEVPAGADPLGDENAFIICTGPLNGTLAHGSGRAGIVTRSPLTGYFMDSYFGGDFGSRLKQSGRDMVVVTGKSSRPVVLFFDDEDVSIIPCGDLWGKTTKETQDLLVHRLGKGISTLCCGPAGENMVSMACCICGTRAAGRGGTGAVMGSKNLKAVSVRGSGDIRVADMNGLLRFYVERKDQFLGLKGFPDKGTPFLVEAINTVGGMGTRNWQQETWEKVDRISAERILKEHFVRNAACFACNMGGCTRVVSSRKSSPVMTEGPEYETLYALGSNCDVDDLDIIIETDRLCDDYGIDTISFGSSLAFLMECFQRGLLSTKDTGGLDLSFGRGEILPICAHLVAKKEGFGDFIARGVEAMAREIAQGADRFACHIRGLEPPGHSARALKTMGIGYAVSPRGGTHHDSRPSLEYRLDREKRLNIQGKAKMAYDTANWSAVRDSLIVCSFCEGVFGFALSQEHADQINRTTGWDLTLEDLVQVGCRIHMMERLFNCREGLRRSDDRLPPRFLHEEIPSGNSKGLRTKPQELQQMLNEYYELRGWDSDGVPTKNALSALGLDDLML